MEIDAAKLGKIIEFYASFKKEIGIIRKIIMHNYVSPFIVATAFGDAATSEP